ncbi:helix-turn-helix domain-containing protein [Brevibacillus sp. GCM10020057]|uniref:helix-turn-helix domain-containing protein n=1 Tax=Brevibacillus sp. GCM10020057 TaxID=3317327 RepID=UPI003629D49B
MEELNTNIGENIKRIRKERDLSLEKISELTGVSKTMLGQIERGKSAPTITTLWKIATGLRLSFSSLVSQYKPPVSLVKRKEIIPIIEKNGGYKVYPLVPYNPEQHFEIFSITLDPGCEHIADPHNTGVEEFIIVNEGALEVVVNEQVYSVDPEDTIIFKADRPHIYRNNGNSAVKCTVVIHYSS